MTDSIADWHAHLMEEADRFCQDLECSWYGFSEESEAHDPEACPWCGGLVGSGIFTGQRWSVTLEDLTSLSQDLRRLGVEMAVPERIQQYDLTEWRDAIERGVENERRN